MKYLYGLIFLLASPLFAQHSVSGTITSVDDEPVIGATVYLTRPDIGGITDLQGNFFLNEIPKGSYVLQVSALGFESQNIDLQVPVNEPLKIELAPSAIEMKEIIISTPFHQLQSDNVMKVERVDLSDLNQSSINLAEGLAEIAGVETITTGAGIGKPVIRGLSSNRVLVYTQGVRLENQQFGGEHGLGVSAAGIESVEVIKGPASLLYGSDALGGVLYLNPERFAPSNETLVDAKTVYYTNTNGYEAGAGIKTSGENLKFLLRGTTSLHGDYETGDDLRVTNTRFREWDLKTGIGYRTDQYKGDLRYNFNNSKTGIPEEIGEQTTTKNIVEPFQWVKNHILSFDNSLYFENSVLDVKLGYLFNDRREFEEEHHEEEAHEEETAKEHEEHIEGEPALEMHLETISYDVKYNFPKRAKLETIFGIQGMYQTNTNLGEEILIPNAFVADVGFMGTTHYHLENWDFQAGLRYDHRHLSSKATGEPLSEEYVGALERNFNSYNGALGVKADFWSKFSARLNIATGFRAPNLAELTSYGSHHGSNRFEIGNPTLENEQNVQLDLALEYANEHFEVFANAFYNRIWDYIYLNPTGTFINEDPVFEYLQNNAKLYGGEAGLHIHPHPLDWLHIESSYEMVIGKQDSGSYLPLIPANSFLNTLRVEFPEHDKIGDLFASVSLKTVFEQDNTSIFETQTSGYSLLSASFGTSYILSSAAVSLRISGTNLLDRNYISHLSRLKPEGIANMGRNISISAGVTF